MTDWMFLNVSDSELDEALKGQAGEQGYSWPRRPAPRPSFGVEAGVLIDAKTVGRRRPTALVLSDQAGTRLFGRYSQLRSDLSPISAWTHVLSWRHFDQLECEARPANLGGFEASWIGLAIVEALILSERPLSTLKLATCLATPTYAVARSRSLWPLESLEAVLARYDQCQKLLRATDVGANRLRGAFLGVWRALLNVGLGVPRDTPAELRLITKALLALHTTRRSGQDECFELHRIFDFPEANFLMRLKDTPAERRLDDFDSLVSNIEALPIADQTRRNELLFLAGYLVTIAAGGAPSLGLAERLSGRWPQIAAWAYVIGGIGETVTWTSSFDGLGRLVARDLMRPFRLDDAPTSDFALEEALVLVDRALQDPLVHLRVKQSRVMSVALLPGVNVAVPLAEAPVEGRTRESSPSPDRFGGLPLGELADAIWPYLEARFLNSQIGVDPNARRSGRSRGAVRAPFLPLGKDHN